MDELHPRFEKQKLELARVSPEQSMAIAHELYTKHQAEITEARNASGIPDEPLSNDTALHRLPNEIKKQYWGHGILRKNDEANLGAAISIIQNSAIIGSVGPMSGGMPNCYTEAELFFISHKGSQMFVPGADGRPERVSFGKRHPSNEDVVGIKVVFGALIVSGRFAPVVDDLRKMYPDVKILRPEEIDGYIQSEEAGNSS